MRTIELQFVGEWAVVALEYRVAGEWRRECELPFDDWSVGFLPNGRYLEIYRLEPEGGHESGSWTFDERTGIISVRCDGPAAAAIQKCIFASAIDLDADTSIATEPDPADFGYTHLYYYDDEPHIRPDRNTIMAHHAHTRIRLARR